jgi:hypothetical protein
MLMPIATTNTFQVSTVRFLDIDCSAAISQSAQEDIRTMIGWVESQPKRRSIHVILRFATSNPTGRKLKTLFQALGCTVSMRTCFA